MRKSPLRFGLLVAVASVAPALAAGPISGPYVNLGAGVNFLQDSRLEESILAGQTTSRFNGQTSFKTGFVGVAALGWGFGNGLRAEVEGTYRHNDVDRIPGATRSGGFVQKYGAMVNLLYDFDLGWPITPYIGIGFGEQTLEWRNGQIFAPNTFVRLQHPDINIAYQAIVGAAYDLPVPGLSLTVEYRFLGMPYDKSIYGQYFAPGLDKPAEVHFDQDNNHSILLGVRYAFNAAPPPVVVPVPVAPAPAPTRTYLVFFDWDRADLTDRARQIIAEAAQATTRVPVTRIEVDGHTDRSGTARYNQGLSLRRAQNVATELVRLGVPRGAITIEGFGESRPLVPTADGVREPQNRRVEIVLR